LFALYTQWPIKTKGGVASCWRGFRLFIKRMKEGKIKNFIKLIHKIHKGKQDLPDIVVDTFTD
jgi:hypothetical protein